MPEPDRTDGGHRIYEDRHRRRLAFIRRARELGFRIEEIRTLLDLARPQRRACAEVRPIAWAHLSDVRAKIADLTRLEAMLAEAVSRCAQNGSAPSCSMLDLLEASS
jgi:MerR family transcriptional regulator, mercuric resistance operon regulatory protein